MNRKILKENIESHDKLRFPSPRGDGDFIPELAELDGHIYGMATSALGGTVYHKKELSKTLEELGLMQHSLPISEEDSIKYLKSLEDLLNSIN